MALYAHRGVARDQARAARRGRGRARRVRAHAARRHAARVPRARGRARAALPGRGLARARRGRSERLGRAVVPALGHLDRRRPRRQPVRHRARHAHRARAPARARARALPGRRRGARPRAVGVGAARAEPGRARASSSASLERDRERLPEVAARVQRFTVYEPWREKLWYMRARLRATLERGEAAYVDAAGYQRDLLAARAQPGRAPATASSRSGALRDCRRRAEVFGFHLASLDLRQHSGVHERVVAELLAAPVGRARGYAELDEAAPLPRAARAARARRSRCAPPSRAALSAETQELLATLDMVGRARREQGPRACERYVVSFTSTLSDLLEVLFLQRAAGLAPGRAAPGAAARAARGPRARAPLAEQMLASPHVSRRARPRARGDGRLLRLVQAGRLRRPARSRCAARSTRSPTWPSTHGLRSPSSTAAAARSAAAAGPRTTRSARSPSARCAAGCA